MGAAPGQAEVEQAHLSLFLKQRRDLADVHAIYAATQDRLREGEDDMMLSRIAGTRSVLKAMDRLIALYDSSPAPSER